MELDEVKQMIEMVETHFLEKDAKKYQRFSTDNNYFEKFVNYFNSINKFAENITENIKEKMRAKIQEITNIRDNIFDYYGKTKRMPYDLYSDFNAAMSELISLVKDNT
jgi:hypothetical protein